MKNKNRNYAGSIILRDIDYMTTGIRNSTIFFHEIPAYLDMIFEDMVEERISRINISRKTMNLFKIRTRNTIRKMKQMARSMQDAFQCSGNDAIEYSIKIIELYQHSL